MKKLLMLFIAGLSLVSCSESDDHEVRYSPDGKDSVVYVKYRDEQGNQQNFLINYLLFRSLMDGGGYRNVYNYHSTHPSSISRYNNYKSPSYTTRPSTTTTSSPARNNSSFFRNSSSSKSYSTPSRSYSSPSRSYSSPSRSYSSPSRSYSSPSRSYSSPSRH